MKPIREYLCHSILALFASALSGSLDVRATDIAWSNPTNISGESDVSVSGTLVNAFNMAGSDVTVNGVLFSAFAVAAGAHVAANGNYSFVENQGILVTPSLGSDQPPFINLSASYQTLLSTAISADERDLIELTISGLTIGQQYQFQWWCNASTLAADHGFGTGALAGNLVVLDENTSDANGGIGQMVIGTFTADSTSQIIGFGGSGNGVEFPTVNAFQLRSVPEPTKTLFLFGPALVLITFLNIRTTVAERRGQRLKPDRKLLSVRRQRHPVFAAFIDEP